MNEKPIRKTLINGALIVELDRSQVFPDDPGNGTPAMVRWRGFSATYWCAVGEEELHNWITGEAKKLPASWVQWLGELDREITEFLYE